MVTVTNSPFIQLSQLPLEVQIAKGSNLISSVAQTNIPVHTPQTVGSPSISRSDKNADQTTNVTITFTHTGVSTFFIIISPFVTPSGNVPLLATVTSVNIGQTALTHSLTNGEIQININSQNGPTTTLVLSGTNSFLIPAGT